MSFHELEISIRPAQDLKVVSSLYEFEKIRYNIKKQEQDIQDKYKSLLIDIYPNIHEGFFDKMLYLIIEKN